MHEFNSGNKQPASYVSLALSISFSLSIALVCPMHRAATAGNIIMSLLEAHAHTIMGANARACCGVVVVGSTRVMWRKRCRWSRLMGGGWVGWLRERGGWWGGRLFRFSMLFTSSRHRYRQNVFASRERVRASLAAHHAPNICLRWNTTLLWAHAHTELATASGGNVKW